MEIISSEYDGPPHARYRPLPLVSDWRPEELRREAFQRFYSFHLKYKSHPGLVYMFLPAIVDYYDLDQDQRAWLVWLNGNTQNPATSMLLLEAAPRVQDWKKAVEFWNDNFKALEWDTDRRHQKSKFGEATEKWVENFVGYSPAEEWAAVSGSWEETWKWAKSQPFMGRLSAWSMTEYAKILLPDVPDADNFLIHDVQGSQSHRNSTALIAGYDAVYWDKGVPRALGLEDELNDFAEDLFREAKFRNRGVDDVTRLTMESALCTYKSWHKPNRRYPNVYSDMAYNRIKRAESHFGKRFDLLWDTRARFLPQELLLETQPGDVGLKPIKQNWYLETGEIHYLHLMFPDMKPSGYEETHTKEATLW